MSTTKEEMMQKYIEQIHEVSESVDQATLEMAFKACGPNNYTDDGVYVAASDETELERVYKGFVADELGVSDKEKGMAMIHAVAEKMSGIRRKYRTVFYYLLARL